MGEAKEANHNLRDRERAPNHIEQHVQNLRKSLQHWQNWEAEYEGLQEEINGFKGEPNTADLVPPSEYS
jgi:unconventional prefoldin RPB5 interactor 1